LRLAVARHARARPSLGPGERAFKSRLMESSSDCREPELPRRVPVKSCTGESEGYLAAIVTFGSRPAHPCLAA